MTTRLLIGDVFERMAELPDGSFDLIVTSPPFLALRSYLPDGHPDKQKEIGSEATPADYLDTLLALTAEWRRLLAPHGSIAIELGDTYAGSGGAGGDYGETGWRVDQQPYSGSAKVARTHDPAKGPPVRGFPTRQQGGGSGWPLEKSLTGIPTLYAWSLAYGRNLLTGQPSPAGQWRIRNLKPWIRSNPPVGALGDKERPATSYITVACISRDRWFDLDAVRTAPTAKPQRFLTHTYRTDGRDPDSDGRPLELEPTNRCDPGGAPPLDWWHPIDALIDDELRQRADKVQRGGSSQPGASTTGGRIDYGSNGDGNNNTGRGRLTEGALSVGANGTHIRRRLEAAGYLTPQDFHDISPKGYAGAHYAVWPPELVRQLIDEMCPRRVCRECGVPSRRITGEASYVTGNGQEHGGDEAWRHGRGGEVRGMGSTAPTSLTRQAPTLGWSDCGHDAWRPGRILDPFGGSGTTGAVASGMGRDSVMIDLDERNADLCQERVGMFLEIDYPEVPA